MIRSAFPSPSVLSIVVLLVLWTSSALAQEPTQPPIHLDSSQVLPLQDFQGAPVVDQPAGALILPDSLLRPLRPKSVARVRPNQVDIDTSIATDDEHLAVDRGEVVVLSEGSTFHQVPISVDPSQAEAVDEPGAVGEPIFQAPTTWVSNPASGPPTQGTLLMRSMQDGFVMSEQPRIFETTLQIWLASGNGMNRVPLASPTQIVVSVDDAVSVESSPFELTHFNDVTTVHVRAAPQRDSVAVSVGLPTQHASPRAVLDVRRPELYVSANPTLIEGFGLGKSTVQVRVPGSYPAPVTLSVTTQAATAKPAVQKIEPGTAGTFRIRSWGVGQEKIRVKGGPFAEAGRTVRIDFAWPVYFILFALVGSLVGGGIRYYRRRSAAGDQPVRLPGILTSGLLIGIVGAVLYGIGVSLFPGIPTGVSGQAVVFVVSAAAAVTGPNLPFEDTLIAE